MNKILGKRKLKTIIGLFTLVLIFTCLPFTNKKTVTGAARYPYLLKVNKQQNVITVYKRDKAGKYTVPHKAFVCSTGAATPIGTFKTPQRYRWKLLDGNVWGQYSTRITKGFLFHSVWYYKQDPSTLSSKQYNKLGTMASHGCIRVSVADAKWIYDNCPIGTTVKIYNSKNPGPLGKPKPIKLKEGTKWDPTDIWSKKNPFNKKKPSIVGAKNKTVKYGAKLNLKKGVKAISTTGFSITSDMKVKGKVNTKKAGKYKITYSVTDPIGRKASKTVTYKVLQDTTKPVLTGVTNKVVAKEVKIDRTFALKGVKATLSKKALNSKYIKTNIIKNKNNTYTIKYLVTAPNGQKASKTALISIDNEPPKLTGVTDKEIAIDTVVDRNFALKGITVKDNYAKLTTKDIKVTIKDNGDETYNVTYKVSDNCGNVTVKEALFTVLTSME